MLIPCHNKEDCPFKKELDGKKYCDKPAMPILAPTYCMWRRLSEA